MQRRPSAAGIREPLTEAEEVARTLEREGVAEIVGGRVARAERLQIVALLDEFQDGARVVLRVVDEALLGEWRDDERRHARAGAPFVDLGRRHMIPGPAVLVIGDDDCSAGPKRTLLERLQDFGHLVIAARDVGTARMLVLPPDRLPEGYRRQAAVRDGSQHVCLVLQMLLLRGTAVAELLEISERLVVELEELVRLAGERVVPAPRI